MDKRSKKDPTLQRFARELSQLRRDSDLSQNALAAKLRMSGATIGHYERAERALTKRTVTLLDEALDARGTLLALWPQLSQTHAPAYATTFFGALAHASLLRDYHPLLVPGLLQSESYARATIKAGSVRATEEEVEKLVEARMHRQEEVSRSRLTIWAIVSEQVIRHLEQDPDILKSQIDRLLSAADTGRVELQVLPSTLSVRRHPGLSGAFSVLTFSFQPDLMYVEGPGSGTMITDGAVVEETTLAFGRIQAAALSPEQTVDFLKKIRGDLHE
ncbi:helix-turn-helix domain-containing protein [Nocardiopsis lambiniae]|uniref:Helix-turn-helix transcriptional regulator n=1 Tax=Nocardiopsis lambiniae TaxID=3075539 RepID=A0ABU2MAA4_9ACTN|nr:helix-turn-helix transcriptional regulator [Nocardiopsis sp. DSM 44743]MDT0329542.1 helix-turn-helix transcriptional regulator [Nocardiopsis sp. DSM 44743]